MRSLESRGGNFISGLGAANIAYQHTHRLSKCIVNGQSQHLVPLVNKLCGCVLEIRIHFEHIAARSVSCDNRHIVDSLVLDSEQHYSALPITADFCNYCSFLHQIHIVDNLDSSVWLAIYRTAFRNN